MEEFTPEDEALLAQLEEELELYNELEKLSLEGQKTVATAISAASAASAANVDNTNEEEYEQLLKNIETERKKTIRISNALAGIKRKTKMPKAFDQGDLFVMSTGEKSTGGKRRHTRRTRRTRRTRKTRRTKKTKRSRR